MSAESSIESGEYLVKISGCHDCHSPKVYTEERSVLDTTGLLSGQPAGEAIPEASVDALGPGKWVVVSNEHFTAWAGAWGVSFAANLTPDTTGMQAWKKEKFIEAMRTGKNMGQGRPILPPMPWPNVALMTDDDLGAVFNYLMSVKPINNPVPQPIPPMEG